MTNTLAYFTATGFIYDIEQPDPAGTTGTPVLADVSAYVDFYPGTESGPFPAGFALLVPDLVHGDATTGNTEVPLAPITGRLLNGALCSIAVGDPVGVGLLANSAFLGLPELLYHVRFRNVTFGGANQVISNFAFVAPVAAGTLDLFASTTHRFEYKGP